jgi:hypothetical protein
VTKQFLDDPQVGTVVEHVGRTGVSQYVRGQSLTEGDAFSGATHNLPARLTRDPTAARIEDHRVRVAWAARA